MHQTPYSVRNVYGCGGLYALEHLKRKDRQPRDNGDLLVRQYTATTARLILKYLLAWQGTSIFVDTGAKCNGGEGRDVRRSNSLKSTRGLAGPEAVLGLVGWRARLAVPLV